MSLPRIAVVGSCVSRDPFNREFVPDYKSRAELVASVYQSSMPSLVRETEVKADISGKVSPNFLKVIQQEFSGNNLERLVESRPDVLVVDFYADTQFGVTTVDRQYVTRNHMAFTALKEADEYFKDEGRKFPDRARFEGSETVADGYCNLAKDSIESFLKRIKDASPDTLLVLNSARLSPSYIDEENRELVFPKLSRLNQKNQYWEEIDNIFEDLSGSERIVYPDSLFKGSTMHPWGLHPTHYSHNYYEYFWDELGRVAKF